ncbi:hypothetical protein HELRODRAFT_95831 [Helobdella robusta]|uniref:Ig-like domain-containing protein n=1 Tax=Helobdella robusta TaxID=6412 RepID=T1G980_HELRO|nr:hypothetical protein HELRODRAFT_95831 [Helobdella robusta]ESN94679.1 hypothetical protein HELRODRAFT_95831 [Helobdella robusta]
MIEEWETLIKTETVVEKDLSIDIESRKVEKEDETVREDMYEEWETIMKKEFTIEKNECYDSDNESEISTQSLYEEWEFTTITKTVVEEEFPMKRNIVEIRYPQKRGTNIIFGQENITATEDSQTTLAITKQLSGVRAKDLSEINRQYTFNQFGLMSETFDKDHKRPVFDEDMTVTKIKIGHQVVLTTHVVSTPEPISVDWFKDGVKLNESNNYILTYENGYCLLTIRKFTSRHIGRYSCRVLNEFGINESSLTIERAMITDYRVKFEDEDIVESRKQFETSIRKTVDQPDSILKKPRETLTNQYTVNEEESLYETKESWTKVFKEYATSSTSVGSTSLNLKAASTSQSPPYFEEEISSVTVIDGDDATLSCKLFGGPFTSIEWLFRGRKIEKSRDFMMYFKDDCCYLIIKETMPTDRGRYTVRATNDFGWSETHIYLTVMDSYEFNRTTTSSKSLPRVESEEDMYSSGEETLDTWTVEEWVFYDYVNYYNVDVFMKRNQLYITNYSYVPYDEKSFKERISSVRAALTDTHMFRFPVIIKELPILEVFEGKKAVMECVVEASPEPVITWFKNGKEITSGEHVKITFTNNVCTLIIEHVELDDEAEYKCEARNEFGSSFTWGQIYVETVQLRWGRIKNFKIVRKKSELASLTN